jgi:ABC-type oligopeptide transport system substrate-binding subunit
MRIRRSVIIPAILALSAAGAILAGSTAPAVAAQGTTAYVAAISHPTWAHG